MDAFGYFVAGAVRPLVLLFFLGTVSRRRPLACATLRAPARALAVLPSYLALDIPSSPPPIEPTRPSRLYNSGETMVLVR